MNKKSQDLVRNPRAFYDYEILETFEAGIVLSGTEIKSLRDGDASLQEAYIRVIKSEIWLVGSYIAPYRFGSSYNHEEKRQRKLLMHRYEIHRLKAATQEKGLTLVPIAITLKKGKAKVHFALGRGKKAHDKRHSVREKDEKRRMQQQLKRDLH